ncbi:hypothetical protein MSP7336_02906 [Mycobacterium shimoidei]|uniref:Uncharacterized protein n=1 Tax=Mycobacterium shimoidei TaxID=29313 RepID=A0A375YZ19_MYCSH|nr:hypothetical protein [Mycobacterium shimoidei]SRX94087.1 hypothetical protein MSP7336_02335 [Mycobacterium shimoidei]SRX94647.1 hypothetical protein MSP7336_02906 [Mycobacterium shimoidei]
MIDDHSDLIAERDRLQAEVAQLRVSLDTGVPASMLSEATTEDEARAIADKHWRGGPKHRNRSRR